MAERLASQLGRRVLVVDRRPYVGGNAHDRVNEHGIRVHDHGPHLFHTNADEVFEYLSQFTEWTPYEHRVLASVRGHLVPIPINRTTLNTLYGLELDEAGAAAFLADRAEPVAYVSTSEDTVINAVGRELYELFFRGYTRKLWGLDPAQLHASVAGRIPTRTNDDDRYFTDRHQALPRGGYTAMFEQMLNHPNISVSTATDFAAVRDDLDYDELVWTGPIDAYYGHRFGPLPYRSLTFEWETVQTPGGGFHQPVTQVNQPSEDVSHTRVVEYRHLDPSAPALDVSTITYEHPSAEGDPFYPVPRVENRELYHRYEHLSAGDPHVTFVGRLARYQYLNMDQVTAQALKAFGELAARMGGAPPPEVGARRG
jgi:UDP-galactopyranose mutase